MVRDDNDNDNNNDKSCASSCSKNSAKTDNNYKSKLVEKWLKNEPESPNLRRFVRFSSKINSDELSMDNSSEFVAKKLAMIFVSDSSMDVDIYEDENDDITKALSSSFDDSSHCNNSLTSISTKSSFIHCNRRMSVDNQVQVQLQMQKQVIQVVSDLEIASLVRFLLQRRAGVPTEYLVGNSLVRRLAKIFSFPVYDKNSLKWLWEPMYQALMKGDETSLNATISNGSSISLNNDDDGSLRSIITHEPTMSILTWLCQWVYLEKQYDWSGNHDLVSIFLGAGADPNISMKKHGETPIFFAVKYGCLETVKLLVQYGRKQSDPYYSMKIKDHKGRTCLWHALNRPRPNIIRYLLETGLPADENFPYQIHHQQKLQNKKKKKKKKKNLTMTAVDYLIDAQFSLLFSDESNLKKEYPRSWMLLGEPSEEDIINTLIEFGKRGVSFTPNSISLSLFNFILRDEDLPPMKPQQQRPICYHMFKERLKRIVNFMTGRYLPRSQRDQLVLLRKRLKEEKEEQTASASSSICVICNEDRNITLRQSLRLYCGHDNFCLGCVLGRANVGKGNTNCDSTCPICHKKLCLDITKPHTRKQQHIQDIYGEYECYTGPAALTVQQLLMECRARGITDTSTTPLENNTKENLKLLLEESMKRTRYYGKGTPDFMPFDDDNINTTTTKSIHDDDDDTKKSNNFSLLFPLGVVVVPIIIQGIPILAYISMTSTVTLLSPEFVELYGLQKIHQLGTTTTGTLHAVDEFHLQIGSIDVCLRNAFESSLLPDYVGIQLGLDFLRSGAWCTIDAIIDKSRGTNEKGKHCVVSMDGYDYVSLSKKRSGAKEELRYYSHDGKKATVKLLRLRPVNNNNKDKKKPNEVEDKDNKASIATTTTIFQNFSIECNWCCRVFPDAERLIRCGCCSDVYYCNTSCRDAAREVHSLMSITLKRTKKQM